MGIGGATKSESMIRAREALKSATDGDLPSEKLQRDLLQLQARARLELVRREKEQANGKVRRILDSLFPAQRDFVTDVAKERAALCTRRAGKSHGTLAFLCIGALETPGSLSAYICISRPNAEMYFWPSLKAFGERFDLNLTTNEAKLIATFPNGSRIKVGGCPDRSHIEAYRGPAYRRVAVDEAASFGSYIRELLNDVISPGLLDHSGELALTGTPGVVPAGLFYDVTTGGGPHQAGWSTHSWSVLDNPHLPNAREDIERMKLRNGWTDATPTYQREYLGKWVQDLGSRVYTLKSGCMVDALPEVTFRYILGIDLGSSATEPTTAFSIIAYSPNLNVAYVVDAQGYAGLTAETIAGKIKFLDSAYRFDSVVMDAGGLGGGYIREINERHRLNVKPATKTAKVAFIELFNNDIACGKLKFLEDSCMDLADQYNNLAWASTNAGDQKKEGAQPNHLADATLYAWRESRHFDADIFAEKIPKRIELEEKSFKSALEASARRANGGTTSRVATRRKSRWMRGM